MGYQSHKLEINYEFDFFLLGIVTPVREYKLAWYLNKYLNISLKKYPDAFIEFQKKNNLQISFLSYEDEYHEVTLILNKSIETDTGYTRILMNELKNYDFFLKLKGPAYEDHLNETIAIIKKISLIHHASQIDLNKLKYANNLLF